jgi:hypothetical protein
MVLAAMAENSTAAVPFALALDELGSLSPAFSLILLILPSATLYRRQCRCQPLSSQAH